MGERTHSATGTMLGERYRLERLVARGGMAEIWQAWDVAEGATVAVKRLLFNQLGTLATSSRARLLREAEALRLVQHQHVVSCLDAGFDDDGQPYLALEWLEGDDLEVFQQREPIQLELALTLVRQALRGLGACHERGIVHRDVKPANLFIVRSSGGEPRLKVVDFGVAHLQYHMTRLTRSGAVLGTLYYMAPEQVRGTATVDHRADLYAMGVVLYQLVTGKLPFYAEQPVAVMLKIVSETPPWPSKLCPGLPPWLEDAIMQAMRRSPADRFATAAEMLEALSPEGSSAPAHEDPARQATVELSARTRPPAGPSSASGTEQRLVSLLCAEPTPREKVGPPAHAAFEGAVQEAGGTSHGLIGGQLVGLFGLQRTAGDEALRAVRAGLRIRDAGGQRLRILAATIHVEVGQGLHLDSHELDRATRSMAGLPPGELVVDETTGRLVSEQVVLVDRDGHRRVSALRTDLSARRQILGVETPTVGRESELAGLRATFERALEIEEPEAVLIVGPAGIGKSRLLQDLLPELRRAATLCLEARPDSSRAHTPYSLLAEAIFRAADIRVGQDEVTQREALSRLVARHVDEARRADVVTFLGEAIGLSVEPTVALAAARADFKVMQRRVADAAADLLEGAGGGGPICVCLDDLQWADPESLRLLVELIERLDRTPLLVVGTGRPELLERAPELLDRADAALVELKPLGRRAMSRLVRAILGAELPREVQQVLVERSDGNPYFAEELISWMVASDVLRADAAGRMALARSPALEELPAGVEAAIQGRLDQLQVELKELLKAAAVFGEVLWSGGCEALGFAGAAGQLARLASSGYVVRRQRSRFAQADEWAFRHALLRQVALGMLPQQRRQELHLLAARWLEDVGELDAAVLAHHFRQGGDLARAADYDAAAGAKALLEGGLERAVTCYTASLDDVEAAPGKQAERLLGLARAHYRAGQYDEAWQTLDRLQPLVAQLAGDTLRNESRVLRGQIHFCRAKYAEAEQELALSAAAPGERVQPEWRFEAHQTLFYVIWCQGRYEDAARVAERLFEMAELDGRGDHLCAAKLALVYYHLVAGDLSRSVALAEEAVEHAREIVLPFREVDALLMLASIQELAGRFDDALATLRRAADRATRLKSTYHLAGIEVVRGRAHATRGDPRQGLESYAAAARHAQSLGDDRTLALALCGEARALCLQDARAERLERALAAAHQSLELVSGRAPPVEAEARLSLALVQLALGQGDPAAEQALAAVALLDELGTQERYEVEILLAAHDALTMVGRAAEAQQLLERAVRALDARAGRISDPALRASYREVPHNARLARLRDA